MNENYGPRMSRLVKRSMELARSAFNVGVIMGAIGTVVLFGLCLLLVMWLQKT